MAKLISIIETPEAITAEASAYIWEEYDAPRKRVPRARIVEHRFTVSIPKYTEEAAPVAFVIERFPQMSASLKKYFPGYDEPVRYAAGRYYTPARLNIRHRYGSAYDYESTDPRKRAVGIVSLVTSISDRDRERYAEAIERHEIRADEYPARYPRADVIADDVARNTFGLVIIGGEVWEECKEPAYTYTARGWFSSRPGYVNASTSYTETDSRHIYGAADRVALAYHHAGAPRLAYIDVKRPGLVTIDHTARKLAEEDERKSAKAAEIREKIERLSEDLKEAQAEADEARANLDSYAADPRAYWASKCARLETIEDGTPFKASRSRRAAATRRELEKEA